MGSLVRRFSAIAFFAGVSLCGAGPMKQFQLIVLDPGHFHAALLQKEMYPRLSKRVSVYAPLGTDVLDYLNRISLFNNRPENPTSWEIDLHTGPDFFERMLRERPGDVVILSGRNRPKIGRIRASIEAGLHVLADKPWIIASSDMPQLERVLDEAEKKGLVACDIMTERFEITSILQRRLVNNAGIFGKLLLGSTAEPAITAKSVHHLRKLVAGVPLRRPAWFFDVEEYGEGLADVGTHAADLVQWIAFPDRALDYRADVRVLSGMHWPTVFSQADFEQITGERDFPPSLASRVKDGKLAYYCNNSVHYTVRGVHVKLDILWNWEAPEGTGDTYDAVFRGSRSRVEVRQGKLQQYTPELYVVPNAASFAPAVFAALQREVQSLQSLYPGLTVEQQAGEARLVIPGRYRIGHEAHFAQVTNKFFEHLEDPKTMPVWEKANMLLKYFVTTKGVELSQPPASSPGSARPFGSSR
jgi:predicted dehydrogenase